MSAAIQDKVLAATMMCLRPLARLLLRSGINYRQFADAAKIAFLEEAASERDARGRVANVSRMAIRTGLSRKEVARIRDRRTLEKGTVVELVGEIKHAGHAARVLQLWYSDARFVDSSGEPSELRFAGDGVTFTNLVRLVGGDVPAGAVRAELVAAGSVEETAGGGLRAVKRYFVPGNVNEDLVIGLTQIVQPVIEGLVRNTGDENVEPFVQRLAYSDRLLPAAVPLFRHIARSRCSDFVQSIDDWLSSNEIAAGAHADESLRVGVGVFYFEGTAPSGAE
ncbi:MAG TPA: DUF6502 family protein [Burkholderiaceae bacterium]|nr:DUF6502 family protein [Steroidobacteraceae bacterium]HQR77911.1 DUF6502 family protein [Burkholderiaceae bacterium]